MLSPPSLPDELCASDPELESGLPDEPEESEEVSVPEEPELLS